MQPLDKSNVCNDAPLIAIPTACPQFKFAKFMMTKPPVFEGSIALNDAESWIHTIKEKLTVVQCNDNEKFFYDAHQLEGVALDWWEKFRTTHQHEQTITWSEFTAAFRQQSLHGNLLYLPTIATYWVAAY